MEQATIINRLLIISRDELAFLQRGYGEDAPDYVRTEAKELLAGISWLQEKAKALGIQEATLDQHTGVRA